MLFRPIELCWNSLQKGFSLFTFAFPDDSYYALLAVIRLSDCDGWWISIFFNAFLFAPEEYTIELEDDDDD
jgi:hypothetical protein